MKHATVDVREGDSRELIKGLADNSVDAVVTDPPYALESIVKRFGGANAAPAVAGVYGRSSRGFMGQAWDTSEVAHDPGFWSEVYRVVKPGGWVLAFSATRTAHRMGTAVDLAGFDVRDQLQWLYGSGFPKNHDTAYAIETTLCDLVEVGSKRKWLYKADGLPIHEAPPYRHPEANAWLGWGTALKPACEPIVLARKPLEGTVAANVLAHGCGALNVDACRVPLDMAADARDLRTVERSARAVADNGHQWGMNAAEGGLAEVLNEAGRWPANVLHDGSAEIASALGDVSRYFPAFPWTEEDDALVGGRRFLYAPKAGEEDRMGSAHPTVKPIGLMAWLVRLVARPGAVVLDPFAGSGTTGQAALRENVNAILFEREAAFAEDCRRRVRYATGEITLEAALLARVSEEDKRGDDLPLFSGL